MTMRLCALLALAGCGYDFDRFHALDDASTAEPDAALDASASTLPQPASPAATARDASAHQNAVEASGLRPPDAQGSAPEAGAVTPPREDASQDADALEADGSAAAPQAPQEAGCQGAQGVCREPPSDAQTRGLRARYDFAGTGSVIADRVGRFHGALMNAAPLDGSGTLTLDGADDFVDLPDDLLHGLHSLTVLAWVERFQDVCWQRLFDFGGNLAGQPSTVAHHSLFLTATNCPEQVLTVVARRDPQRDVVAGPVLPQGRPVHVAVTFDGDQRRIKLYVDGVIVGEAPLQMALAELVGANTWLGRSQWAQDGYARVRYEELRIYDRALDLTEIAVIHGRGPDAP